MWQRFLPSHHGGSEAEKCQNRKSGCNTQSPPIHQLAFLPKGLMANKDAQTRRSSEYIILTSYWWISNNTVLNKMSAVIWLLLVMYLLSLERPTVCKVCSSRLIKLCITSRGRWWWHPRSPLCIELNRALCSHTVLKGSPRVNLEDSFLPLAALSQKSPRASTTPYREK